MNPKVSVLMPVYNGEKYVLNAINSVLYQTYKNFELIIINDGSTDSSNIIISGINDSRIIYIENEDNQNKGLFYTHNRLIEKSSGEYIKFVHQDDLLYPNTLEQFVILMENHKDVAYAAAPSEFIDENGISMGTFPWGLELEKKWAPNELTVISRRIGNIIGNPPSVFFRSTLLKDIRFDENLKNSSDWKVLLDLAEAFPVYTLTKALTKYRIHNESQSTNNHTSVITAREDMEILNKKNKGETILHFISGHWRQHLQIFHSILQQLMKGNYSEVIILIKFLLEKDHSIDLYENGMCKDNLTRLFESVEEISNGIDIAEINFTFSSNLYSWFIKYGIGLNYEFYDFLMSRIALAQRTQLLLVGYDPILTRLISELIQVAKIDIIGVVDVFNNVPFELGLSKYDHIEYSNADSILIMSPTRIADFKIWYQLFEQMNHFQFTKPIHRLREWIL